MRIKFTETKPRGAFVVEPERFEDTRGFQTLEDETEIFYQVSECYAPASEGGVRWDDPAFGIDWPERNSVVINERDRTYPDFGESR